MSVIGPGSTVETGAAPLPILDDASDYEYITLLNPLPDDFAVKVAQDVPVNVPMRLHSPTTIVKDVRDVEARIGFPLKGPDHVGRQPIFNTTIIPAGQTRNFKGSDAQVALRQIVNEVLQREGKKRMMHDPYIRNEAELRIVQRRGTVQEVMDRQMVTPSQQINDAITKSNEAPHEEAFPGLTQTDTGTTEPTAEPENASPSSKRPVAPAKK